MPGTLGTRDVTDSEEQSAVILAARERAAGGHAHFGAWLTELYGLQQFIIQQQKLQAQCSSLEREGRLSAEQRDQGNKSIREEQEAQTAAIELLMTMRTVTALMTMSSDAVAVPDVYPSFSDEEAEAMRETEFDEDSAEFREDEIEGASAGLQGQEEEDDIFDEEDIMETSAPLGASTTEHACPEAAGGEL